MSGRLSAYFPSHVWPTPASRWDNFLGPRMLSGPCRIRLRLACSWEHSLANSSCWAYFPYSPLHENCPPINHYLRNPTIGSPLSWLLLSTCQGNEACHWNIKSTPWGEVRGPVCSGMNQSKLCPFRSLQITAFPGWTSGSVSVPSEALGLNTATVQGECPGSGLTAGEADLDLAPETILFPSHLPNILGIIITG